MEELEELDGPWGCVACQGASYRPDTCAIFLYLDPRCYTVMMIFLPKI